MLIASYAKKKKKCLNVSVYLWVSGIADVSEQVPSLLIPTIHSEDMLRTGCIKKVCEKTRVGETTLIMCLFNQFPFCMWFHWHIKLRQFCLSGSVCLAKQRIFESAGFYSVHSSEMFKVQYSIFTVNLCQILGYKLLRVHNWIFF